MTRRNKIIGRKLRVLNIGVKEFYHALREQGVDVVHVEWKPPAAGDIDLAKLLEKML